MLVVDDLTERLDAGLDDGNCGADSSAAGTTPLPVFSVSTCSAATVVEVLKWFLKTILSDMRLL
jgi:hypothetical protein